MESLQSHCIHTQFHWPVIHPFASRREGPGFNPQEGTYVKPGFLLLACLATVQLLPH
jgi:hypothetical protein